MTESVKIKNISKTIGDTLFVVKKDYTKPKIDDTGKFVPQHFETFELPITRVTKTMAVCEMEGEEVRVSSDGRVLRHYQLTAYPSFDHYRAEKVMAQSRRYANRLHDAANILLRRGDYMQVERLSQELERALVTIADSYDVPIR